MTALEEIKKTLEGRDIATLTNVELVTEISRLLSTLESLQRENEELRKGNNHIAAEKAGIAKNAHSNIDFQ